MQTCVGHIQNILWLPYNMGRWGCSSLSWTLEGVMLECVWLSSDWQAISDAFTLHCIFQCNSFASITNDIHAYGLFTGLGPNLSKVPGALLSMDVDEIIASRAGQNDPQIYFPTCVFHLDTGSQMQTPREKWLPDLSRRMTLGLKESGVGALQLLLQFRTVAHEWAHMYTHKHTPHR